ncbi:MAG: hypothetical protein RLZZ507_491 [Cyanobacteriota bacterium]|jgi:hypothetical protein
MFIIKSYRKQQALLNHLSVNTYENIPTDRCIKIIALYFCSRQRSVENYIHLGTYSYV